ncbi:MAG TPA: hypothetical protein V6C81_11400 [Planktothrix sp.]|jgi:hypothetical protein
MDNTDYSRATAVAAQSNPLLTEFLEQHKKSDGMTVTDLQNCQDASQSDQATLKLLADGKNKAAIAKQLQTDIGQDQQAAGSGSSPGDDRSNAQQDNRIVTLDQRMLSSGAQLSQEQKSALNKDIKTHRLDAQYSNADVGNEAAYAQHDRQLLQALSTGQGVEAATAQVKKDRQADIANEKKYIRNDHAMKAAHQKVMQLFGNVEIR